MSLMTGDTLADRYVLVEAIGSGGMADVFRAEDRVLHCDVAVKVLRDSTDNDTDRSRFASEARTLAGLSHPGLVTVLDAGIATTRPFLVMEFVAGETLAQRCVQGLPSGTVADMGSQLARAVSYAHLHGVIHRDVKPSNVLITPSGQVKLADFGIARLIGEASNHTRTGQAIGTAAYLAPEQVRGEELTPAADVYALGLVLLESLTGEREYPGPATEAALARLTRSPEVPPGLDAMWQQLIARMTHDDADQRPDAAEVATILEDPPRSDPAPTAVLTNVVETVSADRTARRPWVVLGLVAAVLVAILVVALTMSGDADVEPQIRPVPTDVPDELAEPLQDLHDAIEEAR